jgi:hypothetical protein
MSAKKSSKAKTPSTSKKRARFPRTEAALADRPLTEAPAEPTMEASPAEDAGGMTTPEPGPVEAVLETTGVEAPAGDAPPEMVGETPAPQATTEPATVEGAEAGAEGTAAAAPPSGTAGTASGSPDTGKKGRKPRATKPKGGEDDGKAKRLSALDAAARVLGEAGQPMSCKEMIAAMAAKGYWSSPAGRTPEATLYSAILRELTTKGEQARFVKAQRGHFALRPTA